VSRRALAIAAVVLTLTAATPATTVAAAPTTRPDQLILPDGFQPEGIAVGRLPYAYLGSRADGDILRISLRTGRGTVLSAGPGTPSLGLKLDDRGRLFVAGGTGGDARVLDARTGRLLRSYRLRTGTAFVNDVVLTGGAAWFTDSARPVLYALPLGPHGELPDEAETIPLTGDLTYTGGTNANGITATPDGRGLLIVQSTTGGLFRTTYDGVTSRVDLGAETLLNGDGMWLRDRTLYVVQNRDNAITKLRLDRDAEHGQVLSRTKDARFDVPTTIAEWRGRFYLPNARFTTPPTPRTPYTVAGVAIP
jgi:hypothetical protein